MSFCRLRLSVLVLPALLIVGCSKQPGDGRATDADTRSKPIPAGTKAAEAPLYQVSRTYQGEAAPSGQFDGPNGRKVSFQSLVGKPFLVTLWTTYCATCDSQLFGLDDIGHDGKFNVVALNIETAQKTGGPNLVDPFMKAHKYKALRDFRAPSMEALAPFHGASAPTTMLYDSRGRLVWWIIGAPNLASPEIGALLDEAK